MYDCMIRALRLLDTPSNIRDMRARARYVPPNQRRLKGASLAMNPHKPGQVLLGGVFGKFHPLKQKTEAIKFARASRTKFSFR
jgi:hypothetical protein